MDLLDKLGIEQKTINDKNVYIFESHHYALMPWSIVRRFQGKINLISLDHHTDIHDAFLKYVYNETNRLDKGLMTELVEDIDYNDDESICKSIKKLANDEQIMAAINSGILSCAMIISPSGKEMPISYEEQRRIENLYTEDSIEQIVAGTYHITEKKDRTYPKSDIYMPDFEFLEDEEEKDVLSDAFIRRHLGELERICGLVNKNGIVTGKYILDVDLDYFHVPEAAEPIEHGIISELFKNAEIITIAKESDYVKMCSDYRCISSDLLEKILRLIEISV